MNALEAFHQRQLEEDGRLSKMVFEQAQDISILKDVLSKTSEARDMQGARTLCSDGIHGLLAAAQYDTWCQSQHRTASSSRGSGYRAAPTPAGTGRGAVADVFVSPSFQNNLPNTVNGAFACGMFRVCFVRFSSEAVVINGVTGLTACHPGLFLTPWGELRQVARFESAPKEFGELAKKNFSLLSHGSEERRILSHNCRTFAERAFSPTLQGVLYLGRLLPDA